MKDLPYLLFKEWEKDSRFQKMIEYLAYSAERCSDKGKEFWHVSDSLIEDEAEEYLENKLLSDFKEFVRDCAVEYREDSEEVSEYYRQESKPENFL